MIPNPSGDDPGRSSPDRFENAPCGYIVTGADGRISRVNATFTSWTGLEATALAGRPFRDLMTVPGRIFYETNIAPLLRLSGGFEEVLIDLVVSGGEKLPVLVNATVGRGDNGPEHWFVIFRARGRRGYERDLKGREAAALQGLQDEKATSDLREQFIAVLGHDLRNPLASIVGAARLLRREIQSEKGLRVIQLMESSADRMAELIDNVMDFARGRLGSGIDVQRKPAFLEPVLRQVVGELEASEPSRVIECDLDVPEPISFDQGRMAQLVSNLLGNALTHGDPKQPVRLHASCEEGKLVLWVANAGEPIHPAAMDRLFQPFFRGEVRASQQGLGLGLHIASEIAKAHGGALSVDSDHRETRFTFVMPIAGTHPLGH